MRKSFCHGFYDPWLFLRLPLVNIWFSWVQILFLVQWGYFEKIFFQRFVGSSPFGSSNPSNRRKIENGSMEIRKKLGAKKAEKSFEISAFLPLLYVIIS